MLTALFDINFAYDLVLIIAILVLIVICFKYPKGGRAFAGTLVAVVTLGLTVYCGINLNSYYGAQGGIFGYLTGREPTPSVIQVDDFEFKFDNLELLEGDNGRYSATVILDQVMTLDEPNINVFVNDMPCEVLQYSSDYLMADFTYRFFNQDLQETCTDTLSFRFAFFENYTRVTVFTEGDSTALKNWNDFLNANNLILSIRPSDIIEDTTIDFVEDDVSAFKKIEYMVDGELYFSTYQKTGTNFNFPTAPRKTNYEFIGWQNSAGQTVTETNMVSADTVLTAVFQYRETVQISLISNGQPYEFEIFSGEYFTMPTQINGETIENYCTEDQYKNLSTTPGGLYLPNGSYQLFNDLTLYALTWRPLTVTVGELTSNFDNSMINNSLTFDTTNLSNLASFNPVIKFDLKFKVTSSQSTFETNSISTEVNLRTREEGRISILNNQAVTGETDNAQCYMNFTYANGTIHCQAWKNGQPDFKITKITLSNVEVFC